MRFRLDQSQFPKFRKELLLKVTPVVLLPLMPFLLFGPPDTATLILIPFLLVIMVFVMRNLIKRQQKAWETFELTIHDVKVERIQEGLPNISINKTDVQEAVEGTNGAIVLVTKPRANSIIIPFSVQNKTELVELISTFTTIKKQKNNYALLATYVGAVLGIVLLIAFMLSTNFYFTILSGTVLLTFLVWGFIEIQRNKSVDKKLKRSSYAFIFLLLAIASKIFATLTQ